MRVRHTAVVLGIVAFAAGAVVAGLGEATQSFRALGPGVFVAVAGIVIVAIAVDRHARSVHVSSRRRDRIARNVQTIFDDDHASAARRDDRVS